MKIADVSIGRPVFTAMVTLAIMVFGVVLFLRLPVDLFPKVDFPVVTVTVIYPGADPETMEQRVTEPIEEAVNGLAGIKMLRSVSVEGVTQVFIQFDLDVDLDTATQDVRDRVASIQRRLPDGAEAPVVEKLDVGAAPVLQIAVSGPAGTAALSRWAEDVLKPGLEGVRGVGQLEIIGSREREMHVWVDPDRLRGYSLTVLDVVNALRAQNLDMPAGRITEAGRELVVRTNAEARSEEQLRDIPLVTARGAVVRLGDVARVVDGLEEERSLARVGREPALAVVVRKQSDANTVDVAERVYDELPRLERLAPPGTEIDVLVDNSARIKSSIESVQLDLAIGAFLAVAIIFVFLRDPRATFISALALPTSVIGTFAFVKAMDFTLNLMTTLALSLSIGILIDDAIVVIENIVRHRKELREGPREAASRGTAEIGLAVLATTMSIVAVFVPVAFMEGMVGQFFFEFGLTVAFAVLLSLFVSFTLTPMLSARLLKAHEGTPRGISGVIERVLGATERAYRRVIRWALRHRIVTTGIAVAALAGSFALVPIIGTEFITPEDTSRFLVRIELPVGTALSETEATALELSDRVRAIPGVQTTFTTIGGGAQEQVHLAEMIVLLEPRSERAYTQLEAMALLRRRLGGQRRVRLAIEEIGAVSGGGFRAQPIQLNLRGPDLGELEAAATRVADELRRRPGYADVDITYRSGRPQLDVDVERARAADVGVPGAQVATTVRTLVAGQVASQFQETHDRYDVRVQLPPELRTSQAVIERAQVRTATGGLVEIGSVARVGQSTGPGQIDRQSRERQVTVLASLEDKALGDAVAEVQAIADRQVPDTIHRDFSGQAQLLGESIASVGFSLLLAVLFIYMILASQFESLLQPITIMVSLPFSLVGAFGGLLLADMRMSIFAMIGLIMLMGLVTKNAILLVDFAIQLRTRGEERLQALENAGATRLRPILMTTAAMIFGMLPVAIGHGDGGEVRAPMGVTVIGGLITSTFLTLVVVPVVYTFMDGISAKIWGVARRFLPSAEESQQPPERAPAEAE